MFESYDTHELGLRMVQFQESLAKCKPEQVFVCSFLRQMISSMARELLYRYRQETELLYSR